MRSMGWGSGPTEELPHKKQGLDHMDNAPIRFRVKVAIILWNGDDDDNDDDEGCDDVDDGDKKC